MAAGCAALTLPHTRTHTAPCRPGASEDQLDEAERQLGTALCPALRVLYRVHDGQELEFDRQVDKQRTSMHDSIFHGMFGGRGGWLAGWAGGPVGGWVGGWVVERCRLPVATASSVLPAGTRLALLELPVN